MGHQFICIGMYMTCCEMNYELMTHDDDFILLGFHL